MSRRFHGQVYFFDTFKSTFSCENAPSINAFKVKDTKKES